MPLRIPISVFYDNDTSILSIINNYDTEGEVFIYSCNGSVVDYSPRIESEYILTDYDSGEYVITIVGDNWESTGSFVIE